MTVCHYKAQSSTSRFWGPFSNFYLSICYHFTPALPSPFRPIGRGTTVFVFLLPSVCRCLPLYFVAALVYHTHWSSVRRLLPTTPTNLEQCVYLLLGRFHYDNYLRHLPFTARFPQFSNLPVCLSVFVCACLQGDKSATTAPPPASPSLPCLYRIQLTRPPPPALRSAAGYWRLVFRFCSLFCRLLSSFDEILDTIFTMNLGWVAFPFGSSFPRAAAATVVAEQLATIHARPPLLFRAPANRLSPFVVDLLRRSVRSEPSPSRSFVCGCPILFPFAASCLPFLPAAAATFLRSSTPSESSEIATEEEK